MTLRLLFLLLFCGSVSGQSPFQKVITNSSDRYNINSFTPINNSYFFTAKDSSHPVIGKMDNSFNIEWVYSYDTISFQVEYFNCYQDDIGNIHFTRTDRSSVFNTFSHLKIDSLGNLVSSKVVNLPSTLIGKTFLLPINDNGALNLVEYRDSIDSSLYVSVHRTNENDSVIWNRLLKGSSAYGVGASGFTMAFDSTFFIMTDMGFLYRIDLNGNFLQTTTTAAFPGKLISVPGGIIYYGAHYLFKFDINGNELWSYMFPNIIINELVRLNNGHLIGSGNCSLSTIHNEYIHFELDSDATVLQSVEKGLGFSRSPALVYHNGNVLSVLNRDYQGKLQSLLLNLDSNLTTGCPDEYSATIIRTNHNLVPGAYTVTDSSIILQQSNLTLIHSTGETIVFDQCSIVETPDEMFSRNLSVYPNPTSGRLTISVRNIISNPLILNFYSLDGRLVFSKDLDNPSLTETFDLNLYLT